MKFPRRALFALGVTAPVCAGAETAWPERPVRVVVPFPPGSTPDTAGRAVANHFSSAFGQPFVVENRPGAGGTIGTDAVAKATDGHTIGVSINAPLTTAKALYPNLPFNPAEDLAPVSLLVRGAQLLVVHPSVPARTLAEFIAYVKANPGKLSFGSVGAGSGAHLAMVDLMSRAGLDMVHVPYKGFPPATLDLVAGRIQAMFVIVAAILPQVEAGKARAAGGDGRRAHSAGADRAHPRRSRNTRRRELRLDRPRRALLHAAGADRPARRGIEAGPRRPADPAPPWSGPASRSSPAAPTSSPRFIAAETTRWGDLISRLGIKAEA